MHNISLLNLKKIILSLALTLVSIITYSQTIVSVERDSDTICNYQIMRYIVNIQHPANNIPSITVFSGPSTVNGFANTFIDLSQTDTISTTETAFVLEISNNSITGTFELDSFQIRLTNTLGSVTYDSQEIYITLFSPVSPILATTALNVCSNG